MAEHEASAGNEFFASVGGGEMGRLMRAKDWSRTLLGPPVRWPQSLLTNLSTCLNSRVPIFIGWGRELLMLYNDAFSGILGAKHPAALGCPGAHVWPEIWPVIGPMLEGALHRSESTGSENTCLSIERNGFAQESWFSFSYCPIRDESGCVGGVFCVVSETTRQVIGERRLNTLRELAARTGGLSDERSVCEVAAEVLRENADDFPSVALHFVEGTDGRGIPLPDRAHAVRITRPGESSPAAILVAGLSPRLLFDDAYRAFLELIRDQIGTALASALAIQGARNGIKELARGENDLPRRGVDLAEVVVHAVEQTSPLFAARAVDLTLSMPAGQLHVAADRARLAQVISDLLGNAAKYTARRGQVELEARREGNEVLLWVRSGGIGIAPDVIPHLFGALAGASVSARSEGRGTEFTVRLPAMPGPKRPGPFPTA